MTPQNGFVDTRAMTSGKLTGTGAESVYDTTVVVQYVINGKFGGSAAGGLAAVTDGDTPSVDVVTGAAISLVANQGMVVVWVLDAAGTVGLIQGSKQAWDGSKWDALPRFPNIDYDTYCPFAYTVVKGASTVSGTWTFGTSNWNATGITATHTNVSTLPSRPQTA